MSGTSLDGLDLVYAQLTGSKSYTIIHSVTYPYPKDWENALKNIVKTPKNSIKLKELDVALGKYFAERIVLFMIDNHIKKLDFIASHGHTVHHQPDLGYTLQIGSGQEIYKQLQIPVVYNFRVQDVLLGGQGAPLVPMGDELLFSEYTYCLNLGGFSNISFKENGVRKAYDICPVNTVLNFYANQLGHEFDDKGGLAKEGQVELELLEELNRISYYDSLKPKSLGVEFLENEIYPIITRYQLQQKDVLRTFVEHVAYQLAANIKMGKVLVTGGGAYHQFLLDRVKFYNSKIELVVPFKELVEYKEALVFALLGKLKLENQVNCLSSVTGASKDHSCGVVIR